MFESLTPSFFKSLEQLKIRTKKAYLGSRQGSHLSARKGHGLEFSDFRAYSPGDDFRHIDWGVYGRTDKVYVRQFREEQELNVLIIVDCSNSMTYPENENKFQLALELAASLGYVALTDGDTVHFSLLGIKNTPKYTNAKSLKKILDELKKAEPTQIFDFETEVRAAISSHRLPGKCFIISDFLFDIESQIKTLKMIISKNFEVSVLQVLGPSEIQLDLNELQNVIVNDSETGEEINLSLDRSSKKEYAKLISSHIHALENYCRKTGISHSLISSKEKVSDVILKRLPKLGILR